MFEKVLVGVDGYDGGRDAAALAGALAQRGEIILVHAYPFERRSRRAALEGYERLLRDEARVMLKRTLRGAHLYQADIRAVADPSPSKALHGLAEAEGAGLIVVGSCHRGPVGRVLLGDASRAILQGASCPVAVAPWKYRAAARPPRVIGVGFDGSPEAREALRVAEDLARSLGARLHIRIVVQPAAPTWYVNPLALDVQGWLDEEERHARRLLERTLGEARVPADGDVVTGQPAEKLQAMAEQVDVIVTGSRDWGPLHRVALGSTSDRLMHDAMCPVIVVPHSALEEQGEGAPTAASTQA